MLTLHLDLLLEQSFYDMGTIDTSPSSIRVALILVLGIVWFYLLNVELRSRNDDGTE